MTYDMKALIFLLYLMIGGSAASACEEEKCDDTLLQEWQNLGYTPNEADLIRLCPPTLEYFNCYSKNIKECSGKDMEEFIESLEEFGKILARSLWNARNLAVEICDEYSTLRRDYLENVDCYVRIIDDADLACRENVSLDVSAFLRKYHNQVEENIKWEERTCLEEVYGLACRAEQLEVTCGEGARRALLTIQEKVNPSAFSECNVEDPLSFRRSFFEHLDLKGKRAELYWFVFQTFSRR